MLNTIDSKDFTNYLNTTFHIAPPHAEGVEAELISVTDLGPDPNPNTPHTERRPFSLVFRLPKEILWPQTTFRITHPQAGTCEIFLVPIGPDKKGMCYEAVYN